MCKISNFVFMCFFVFITNGLTAQQINIAFPDVDGNGIADSLIAGQGYDLNVWARKYPENLPLAQTGDSIEFMQVFKFIGCPNNCTTCYNQYFQLHYGGDGPAYGAYGEDRKYARNSIFLHPGDYLITGNTKKGFAFRQSISVKPLCTGSGNLVGNIIIEFQLTGTTSTGAVVPNEEWGFYPNPTSGTITVTGLPNDAEVKLYNTVTQPMSVSFNDGTIDMSSLPTGMYFIVATQNNVVFGKKLILKF